MLADRLETLGARVSQGYSVYGDFPFKHPLWAGFYGLGAPEHLGQSNVFLNLGTEMPGPGILAPSPPLPGASGWMPKR